MNDCATCIYSIQTGGDLVPYGDSGANLPTGYECNYPVIYEFLMDIVAEGENCPKYDSGR